MLLYRIIKMKISLCLIFFLFNLDLSLNVKLCPLEHNTKTLIIYFITQFIYFFALFMFSFV